MQRTRTRCPTSDTRTSFARLRHERGFNPVFQDHGRKKGKGSRLFRSSLSFDLSQLDAVRSRSWTADTWKGLPSSVGDVAGPEERSRNGVDRSTPVAELSVGPGSANSKLVSN